LAVGGEAFPDLVPFAAEGVEGHRDAVCMVHWLKWTVRAVGDKWADRGGSRPTLC
jgi:hypothetical protein